MELIEFLNARLDRDEFDASDIHTIDCAIHRSYPDSRIDCHCGWPARVLAEVEAKRRILAEHAPKLRTVEWPHDQNGKGEAHACRRCQNAEHTEWHPAPGHAGVLPEGFVAPYVLAPCLTLRLLSLPYLGHPDYREEWRP